MALVGPNGSGKTTLMRIMAGQAGRTPGPSSWRRTRAFPMSPSPGPRPRAASPFQEAEKAFARRRASWRRCRRSRSAGPPSPPESPEAEALLWKHHELQETLEASGYYSRAEAMHRVLTGLGFSAARTRKPCAAFSAGWQMRIALARAILEAPDILLLDEPTNYLDIEARTWLEEFLADFPAGCSWSPTTAGSSMSW